MPLRNQVLTGGLGKADQIIVKVIRSISYVSAACLVGIMFVAFFNVLGEKILHHGIPGSTEIVEYLHVPVVFLSAGFITLDRGHTSIDLLSQKFPPAVQRFVNLFSFLLGAAICSFVGYRGIVQMLKHISVHAMSSVTGFGFPLWPFSFMFALGYFMLAFTFLWSIVRMYAPKTDIIVHPQSEEGGVEA